MILYAISDRRLAGEGGLLGQLSALIRAGVDWLQLREKDLPDRALFEVLRALRWEALRFGTRLLVNGRPDLALASGAAGVHLPAQGLPTGEVRLLCPPPFLVVRSCHNPAEVRRAAEEGADAVTLGPVFPTPSKAPYGPPLGLEALQEACRQSPIPVLALGGVSRDRLETVLRAGAAGVAAIRLFAEMENPLQEVPALRRRAEASNR